MIELYKFGPMENISDPSSFCVKVEAYLKMAGLDYEAHSGVKYLGGAPKGKLPYIRDDGRDIGDSSFIFWYLKDKYGDSLDGRLTAEEQATTHAFMKMVDENLYWVMVHARWKLDHNWAILRRHFFGGIPFPLRAIVERMARRDVLKALHGHGIGRHSDDEIVEIAHRDLRSLSHFLGDKDYFFGDRPSSLDATVYGILAEMILLETFTAPAFDKAREFPNLVAYVHRVHGRYFDAGAEGV